MKQRIGGKMSLHDVWTQGRTALNGWLAIPDTFSAETMAHQGWDSLTVDLQHGVVDYGAAARMLTAIATTKVVPVARVPWLEPGIIMKMLDAGAVAIICPMVNSAAEAASFASCLRYPPEGRRSFGPIRAALGIPNYPDIANGRITGFAMIETREALDAIDDILAVPGLDAVYIGPSDLALSLGRKPGFDPTDSVVTDAVEHILRRAKHHGKRAAMHNGSVGYALKMAALGFDLVTVSSDARLLAAGAAEVVSGFRKGQTQNQKPAAG
jgi:4-hydroxy-2-oxoheptanedioate aldolase